MREGSELHCVVARDKPLVKGFDSTNLVYYVIRGWCATGLESAERANYPSR